MPPVPAGTLLSVLGISRFFADAISHISPIYADLQKNTKPNILKKRFLSNRTTPMPKRLFTTSLIRRHEILNAYKLETYHHNWGTDLKVRLHNG